MSALRSVAELAEIAERVRTPDSALEREELIAAFAGGAHEIRVSVIDAGGRFAIEVRVFRCQEDGEYRERSTACAFTAAKSPASSRPFSARSESPPER